MPTNTNPFSIGYNGTPAGAGPTDPTNTPATPPSAGQLSSDDWNKIFAGYDPSSQGLTNRDGGWWTNGETPVQVNPYGSGSGFEQYLAGYQDPSKGINGIDFWDTNNQRGYNQAGMSNSQALNGLFPNRQILGYGTANGNQGWNMGSGQNEFFTSPNGVSPDANFLQQNISGKNMTDNTGINKVLDTVGPMIPGLFAGAAGLGLLGGGAADTLGGGSFLAANDAAMGGAGFLGSGGYTAAGAAAGELGGGLAGAGLGAAGMGGVESSLSNFGLNPMDVGASGFNSNPFSFSGTDPMSTGDPSWGVNPQEPVNGTSPLTPDPWQAFNPSAMPSSGMTGTSPFDLNSPLNTPSTPFSMTGTSGASSGVPSFGDLVSKYGFDAAKSIGNYLINQKQKADLLKQGQQASNVMGDPNRAPFLAAAQAAAQGNGPGVQSIKDAVAAQASARAAKYGYGGTENSNSDRMLAADLSKYNVDQLNALLGYTGANQNTASTAYMAARDSAIFSSMSYQQFAVLAGKIGADNSGAVGKAAQDLGNSIMNFFS